ncbi:MAG: Hsp20/alpha crystallin family protein [Anaerolineales bacterium]|nr:Hsp20/alpha crystallin family protein [Anaerolineales bacterium]
MKRKSLLLNDIERIEAEMDRLFDEVMPSGRWLPLRRPRTWCPPTDVYETDDRVVVKVEIAGMEEGEFTISLSDRNLTITGVRHDPLAEAQGAALSYQQMEIRYGEFKTDVYLPWAIVENEIEAIYEDGFLKVVLPKATAQKVPVVEIRGAQ